MPRAVTGGSASRRYSWRHRALLWSLDWLPWPRGERVLALYWTARDLMRPGSLRQARRWAATRQAGSAGCWRLTLACVAGRARIQAAKTMVGLPGPAALRPHITIEGEEHLRAACKRGGVLLSGFHFGLTPTTLPLQ